MICQSWGFHSLRTSGATLLVVYAQCQPTSMVVTFRTCSRCCIRLYCNHPRTSSLTSGSFLGGDSKHPDQRKQAYSYKKSLPRTETLITMICGDDDHHEYMGTKKELMREMTNHVRFEGLFFLKRGNRKSPN